MPGVLTETLNSAVPRWMFSCLFRIYTLTLTLTRPGGFGFVDEPIAELFLGTSVMFSDIVGKWSSTSLAVALSIYLFLVAILLTVNISVFIILRTQDSRSGVPNGPRTRCFASSSRSSESSTTSRTAARHGTPSPTTLRPWPASRSRRATRSETCACGWTKSRFELFGDTINTASRMESTVIGGRMQVSEETAELIRRGAVARGARGDDRREGEGQAADILGGARGGGLPRVLLGGGRRFRCGGQPPGLQGGHRSLLPARIQFERQTTISVRRREARGGEAGAVDGAPFSAPQTAPGVLERRAS